MIKTHALTFLTHIILAIGGVLYFASCIFFCLDLDVTYKDPFNCECLPWHMCKWSYDTAVAVKELENKQKIEAEEKRKELTEYFQRFICGNPNDQKVHCCGDQITES